MDMKKRIKLKTKIFSGFTIILVLLIFVVISGYIGFTYVLDKINKANVMNQIVEDMLTIRRYEKNFILRKNTIYLDRTKKEIEKIKQHARETKEKFKQDANKQMMDGIVKAVDSYEKEFLLLAGKTDAISKSEEPDVETEMVNAARAVESLALQARKIQYKELNRGILKTKSIMVTVTLLSIALGMLFAFLITRSVSNPLKWTIHRLDSSAERLHQGARQRAYRSMKLSEGASEQAAATEETSAAMEEIAVTIQQNVENAIQADQLMAKVIEAVNEAGILMVQLMESMNKIAGSSKETGNVIKTIDGIAFQTNLLALNAAIESARAGEAGVGFAVVANEVRNLAIRSSKAARNTSGLINTSFTEIDNGSEIVKKTTESFARIEEIASKVAETIAGITIASREQSHGVEQVNTAIAELDKVTQQNAAIAEQAASASKSMNDQSREIKGFVVELRQLIEGEADSVITIPETKNPVKTDIRYLK